jgi:hypothetical protein
VLIFTEYLVVKNLSCADGQELLANYLDVLIMK